MLNTAMIHFASLPLLEVNQVSRPANTIPASWGSCDERLLLLGQGICCGSFGEDG